jgi:hypothetical protein
VADEAVAGEWHALGRQRAASRRAAGLSQEQLAPLSGYSRSAAGRVGFYLHVEDFDVAQPRGDEHPQCSRQPVTMRGPYSSAAP